MIPNFIWKNKHEGPARENVRRHRSNEGALALPDVQPLGTGRCRLFESAAALEKQPAWARPRLVGALQNQHGNGRGRWVLPIGGENALFEARRRDNWKSASWKK